MPSAFHSRTRRIVQLVHSVNWSKLGRDAALPAVVLLLMSLLVLGLIWPLRDLVLTGANDFLMFYAGAKLVGTSGLYDVDSAVEVQRESANTSSKRLPYVRLPFFGALLWPLGKLPYRTAYGVWITINLAAAIAFVALWPVGARRVTVLSACASLPLLWSLVNGQNHALLLFWLALSLRLYRSRKFFQSGVFSALCADKYHLFTLTPFAFLPVSGSLLAGALTGGVSVLVASTAVQGVRWPYDYVHLLMTADIHPHINVAPNLNGIATALSAGFWVKLGLVASVVAGVYVIARRADFEYSLAAGLVGSYLISPHLFIHDASLLLPAALIALSEASSGATRCVAWTVLLPFPSLLELALPFPFGLVVPTLALMLLCLMMYDARCEVLGESRAPQAAEPSATPSSRVFSSGNSGSSRSSGLRRSE